jgi:hypothetical protein
VNLRRFFQRPIPAEEWHKTPRRLAPRVTPEASLDASRWLLTREFFDPKTPSKRSYYAAENRGYGERPWCLSIVTYDLAKPEEKIFLQLIYDDHYNRFTLEAAVDHLAKFEKSARQGGHLPVPGHTGTYLRHAAQEGLSVDGDGKAFVVDPEAPLSRNVVLKQGGLAASFSAARPPRSWPELRAAVATAAGQEAAGLEAIAGDAAYPRFAFRAQKLVAALAAGEIPAALEALDTALQYAGCLGSAEAINAGRGLCAAAALVSFAQAGGTLYARDVAPAPLKVSSESLRALKELGAATVTAAAKLGLRGVERVPDVFMQGPENAATRAEDQLVLLLAAFPAPAQEPPSRSSRDAWEDTYRYLR